MTDTKIKLRGATVVLLFYKCTAILSKYRAMPHGIRYFGGIPGRGINIQHGLNLRACEGIKC